MSNEDYHKALMEGLGDIDDDGCNIGERMCKRVAAPTPTKQPEKSEQKPNDDPQETTEYYSGYGDYAVYGTLETIQEVKKESDIDQLKNNFKELISSHSGRGSSSVRELRSIPNDITDLCTMMTPSEAAYCVNSPDTKASAAGKLAAKTAICEALQIPSSPENMKSIEVLASSSQAPSALLEGQVKTVADAAGVKSIKITISHSGDVAVAAACLF